MASRSLSSIEDLAEAIRDIDNQLSDLRTNLIDFHQRRIVNAAASVDPNDYVIQKELTNDVTELKGLIQSVQDSITNQPSKISVLTANCNNLLTCGTSPSDISNAGVLLTETGKYLIIAVFDIFADQPSSGVKGQLVINGVTQTGIVELAIGGLAVADSIAISISRQWVYSNLGSNTAKLQAFKLVGSGTAQVKPNDTSITAVFLG